MLSSSCLYPVPCVPTDVAVKMKCSKNQAVVSWSASKGALSYRVTAQSTQGAISYCESTNLTCTLTNLTCGQSYSVQVIAEDGTCSSLPSPATNFKSGRTTQWTSLDFTIFPCECVTDLLLLTCTSVTPVLRFLPPSLSSLHTSDWLGGVGLLHQLGPLGLGLRQRCPGLHRNSPVL